MSSNSDQQYWYNTKTHQVEHGPQSSWENRMGPYETRAAAESALDRAKARNQEWEDDDKGWKAQ